MFDLKVLFAKIRVLCVICVLLIQPLIFLKLLSEQITINCDTCWFPTTDFETLIVIYNKKSSPNEGKALLIEKKNNL